MRTVIRLFAVALVGVITFGAWFMLREPLPNPLHTPQNLLAWLSVRLTGFWNPTLSTVTATSHGYPN